MLSSVILAERAGAPASSLEKPIKSGYLTKKGSAVENWKLRFFVLTSDHIFYFLSKEELIRPIGSLHLRNCQLLDREDDKKPFSFAVWHPERILFLTATNEKERDTWRSSISLAISALECHQGPIVKEGFLMKKGSVNPNWKRRWFMLTDATLYYYENQFACVPKGEICLRGCSENCVCCNDDNGLRSVVDSILRVEPQKNIISLSCAKGLVLLAANSQEECNGWVSKLQEQISISATMLPSSAAANNKYKYNDNNNDDEDLSPSIEPPPSSKNRPTGIGAEMGFVKPCSACIPEEEQSDPDN